MFSGLFKHYCTVCKKRKFAKLMAHSKSTFCNFEKTKFMKNYLLVSFRLHYIKNLGYRSLQIFANPSNFASHLLKKN